MKNDEQVIKDLNDELLPLMQRTHKLINFFGTDDFKKISETQQRYLRVQISAMRTYSDILDARIADLSEAMYVTDFSEAMRKNG